MEQTITFEQLWLMFKRHIHWIILAILVGAISAMLVTFLFVKPQYAATSEIMVSRDDNNADQTQKMMATYKDLLEKSATLQEAADKMNKGNYKNITSSQILSGLSVNNNENSQVISVTMTNKDSKFASDAANAIATAFEKDAPKTLEGTQVNVISKAYPNSNKVSPSNKKNALLGAFAGFFFAGFIALIREVFDKKIRTKSTVEEIVKVQFLGEMNNFNNSEVSEVQTQKTKESITTYSNRGGRH